MGENAKEILADKYLKLSEKYFDVVDKYVDEKNKIIKIKEILLEIQSHKNRDWNVGQFLAIYIDRIGEIEKTCDTN